MRSDDLWCEIPVSYPTLTLGGTITVPTLDDQREPLSIPKGTQPDSKFRIRGKECPRLGAWPWRPIRLGADRRADNAVSRAEGVAPKARRDDAAQVLGAEHPLRI